MTGNSRYVRSLIAAAGMLTGIAGIGSPAFGQTTPSVREGTATAQFEAAKQAAANGKLVRAKNILQGLNSPASSTSLSDDERAGVLSLLSRVSKSIKGLSPFEVSLQTAEECVASGDLRTAEHHCQAVIDAPRATNTESARANAILAEARVQQSSLAPLAPGMLDSAIASFEGEDYAAAKSSLDALVRSGVALDGEQQKLVEAYQNQIVDLERASGRPFRITRVDAAMFQPGVVKRREPAPAPAPQSEPAPAATPTPAPAATPTPAPTPAPKPAPAPAAEKPAATKPVEAPKPAPAAEVKPVPAAPAAATPTAQPEPAPAAAPAPAQPTDPLEQARLVEASAQLAEADAAFEAARYSEANRRYNDLINQYGSSLTGEQRTHCEQRVRECAARQGAGMPSVIDGTLESRKLAREAAVTEYGSYLGDARKALETGDPDASRSHLSSARLRIRSASQYFAQTENEAFEKELADLKAEIDTKDAEIQARTREEQARQQKREADIAKSEASSARSRKIAEAIGRVRALQAEQKYEEALQVTDEILFMDPINPTGLLLKDTLTDLQVVQEYRVLARRKQQAGAQFRVDAEEATFVGPDIMNYPDDWPKLSARRGEPVAFADAEENRRTLAKLETKKTPAALESTKLEKALEFIKAVADVDVDVDWNSLDAVGVSKDTDISLSLSKVSIKSLLDRVLERASSDPESGAAWTVKDGVVFVASKEVIDRERVLAIYDIKDLLVIVPNFLDAPEFNLQTVLQSSQGGGGQSPFQDNNQDQDDEVPLEERVQEVEEIIRANVAPDSWDDTGTVQQFQGNLIITQTPANHREIRGLLSKLREQRSMQVSVEARFLLVSQSFFEQIGFDLDVYWNGDNNQVRAARQAAPAQNIQPSDFFDFTRGGLQRRVTGSVPQGTGGAAGGTSQSVVLPSPLSVIGTPQNSLGLAEALTEGDFATNILQQAPALGIGGQFLDDIQVDFLIKATQADRRTVTLTAPRLTFTNSQRAWVAVATQIAFVSDLQPTVSESAVGFDPDLDVVSEGVVLDVEGTVSADRRYVFLTVRTAVSKIEGFNSVGVTAIAGGQLVNSSDTASFIQTPTVTVTQVKTSVTVPDQGTILLGGQRLITESQVETGVPVLSKIPILNRFFTNRTETKDEQTLLILIKPTVLIQTEEEERHFPGLEETLKFGGR
ncbi:MAG: hypothetical protein ACOYN0_09500 [Phycisphaerales bacterium]